MDNETHKQVFVFVLAIKDFQELIAELKMSKIILALAIIQTMETKVRVIANLN